jgi:4-hydroxybenzoate polyprenyltransferase
MARHTVPHAIDRPGPDPAGDSARPRPLAVNLLLSLRPAQWTKNLIIFAGLIFGGRLLEPEAVVTSVAAFVIFCALSGVVYLINDVMDRAADRQHPLKRHRPIASGQVPVALALGTAGLLGVSALASAFALRIEFGVVSAAYLALLALYSGPLKHVVIIDVLTIAIGFVLRAAAGAVVIGVEIGHWLLIVTLLLALFLALSKRRHELVLLAEGATSHRPILQEYSPYLLDQMISVVTASTLVAYAFSTISPEVIEKFGTDKLGLTFPFPLYGIYRYLYLVHQKEAILRTTPATVLRDYHELMNLAGYQDVIAKDADTALKVNISWHFFFPGSSTTPWQLEGVIRAMKQDGYAPPAPRLPQPHGGHRRAPRRAREQAGQRRRGARAAERPPLRGRGVDHHPRRRR